MKKQKRTPKQEKAIGIIQLAVDLTKAVIDMQNEIANSKPKPPKLRTIKEMHDIDPPISMKERYIIFTSKLKNKFKRKYKYRVIIIHTRDEGLHETLNKWGSMGYHIIDVHHIDKYLKEYTFEKTYK